MKKKDYEIIKFLETNKKYIYHFLELANDNSNQELSEKIKKMLSESTVEFANLEKDKSSINLILPSQINNFVRRINNFENIAGKIILFYGEPGTGKTKTAMKISENSGKKIRLINYNDLISKKMGETSKNLQNEIFKDPNEQEILFFDEFDAILSDRSDTTSSDEYRRVNTILLQTLDMMPKTKTIIFATNFESQIDPAIRRRIHFEFNFNHYNYDLLYKIYISKLSTKKMYKRILKNNDLGETFLDKKIPSLFNEKTTPFDIERSLDLADDFYEMYGEENLFLLIKQFVPKGKLSQIEIIDWLFEHNFSINQIFYILKNEFETSNNYIRKLSKERKGDQ